MTRRISIKYKFLALTGIIVLLAIGCYTLLAISLFNEDKNAYVYDTNSSIVDNLASETRSEFVQYIKILKLCGMTLDRNTASGPDRDRLLQAILDNQEEFAELIIMESKGQKKNGEPLFEASPLHLVSSEFVTTAGLAAADLKEMLRQSPPEFMKLSAENILLENLLVKGKVPLLRLGIRLKSALGADRHYYIFASLRQADRFSRFARSIVYTTYLTNSYGELFAHSRPEMVLKKQSVLDLTWIRDIIKSSITKGAQRYRASDGSSSIVAYQKIGLAGLIVVAEIPVDKAFFASYKLIEKSLYFALLVIAVAFIASILFTSRLTAALRHLYAATVKIAAGDFNVNVGIRTNDEVGALSASFNHMGQEIGRLMLETAQKARMEKELETAYLVQENFFPPAQFSFDDLLIASYFKPATECGGDFWGTLALDKKLVVLIGDATGHGVPAALITAATHSCMTLLGYLQKSVQGLTLTPADIMGYLNASVYHAGKSKIKMTFLVAEIDLVSGAMRYVNASHEMPLVFGGQNDEEVDPLCGDPDPCLGQALDVTYQEHTYQLHPGQKIIFYTDGVTECRNGAGEEFGEKRLVRLIKGAGAEDAAKVKEALLLQIEKFLGDSHHEDDMTFVIVSKAAS
jgi:sigma-B regulation protein RsbU (phosphoserine phosphatase)